MEEILRKLQKEASGSKHRAIKESCTWAIGKGRGRGSGAGQEPPMERVSKAGGRETSTNLFRAKESLLSLASSGWEENGAPGPFKMPGSSALLEGAVAPAAGPGEHPRPRLPHRLHLLRSEADVRVSVAVSFCVCFGGAVFFFEGPLPPLNHRKNHAVQLLHCL